MSGNRAPSVITYFKHDAPGDILIQNVCVPSELCTKYTYYCCLNWNMGRPGGGYCGIQCHEKGNCFIFSLWDPPANGTTRDEIKSVYQSEGKTFTERFGGEGEGLKYMNCEQNWKTDQWYTLVVRRWDCKGHTYFGLWIHDISEGTWIRAVTMDLPLPDIYFESPVACFVEDWYGNGENARGAKYKETFIRFKDGEWECLKTGEFFINQEEACQKWNENYKVESTDGCHLSMITGGSTKPCCKGIKGQIILDTNLCRPANLPVTFQVTEATTSTIKWKIADSTTPQFGFRVNVDGLEVTSAIDLSCRQVGIDCTMGQKVELIIQDILGQDVLENIELQQY